MRSARVLRRCSLVFAERGAIALIQDAESRRHSAAPRSCRRSPPHRHWRRSASPRPWPWARWTVRQPAAAASPPAVDRDRPLPQDGGPSWTSGIASTGVRWDRVSDGCGAGAGIGRGCRCRQHTARPDRRRQGAGGREEAVSQPGPRRSVQGRPSTLRSTVIAGGSAACAQVSGTGSSAPPAPPPSQNDTTGASCRSGSRIQDPPKTKTANRLPITARPKMPSGRPGAAAQRQKIDAWENAQATPRP